jgi:hypothetical protein
MENNSGSLDFCLGPFYWQDEQYGCKIDIEIVRLVV